MTPVSLFLSSAGVSLTIIYSDRLGVCPATRPDSCPIACHRGHDWSRGATGWTTAQPQQTLLSGMPACTQNHTILYTSYYRGIIAQYDSTDNIEKDRRRLFTGLTLMPCGLYIWLAARLSLYPPVWLITWRRVSTWNGRDTDKRHGQTKALDNKDSHAQGKVSQIVKGYRKQEKVTNSESE